VLRCEMWHIQEGLKQSAVAHIVWKRVEILHISVGLQSLRLLPSTRLTCDRLGRNVIWGNLGEVVGSFDGFYVSRHEGYAVVSCALCVCGDTGISSSHYGASLP
jgi:hypothetical protein